MRRRGFLLLALLILAGAVAAAHAGSLGHGFLNFDDPVMVVSNPLLEDPGPADMGRAFTEVRNDAWLPLYTLSFMPETALFGKDPAALHAASLIWHLLAAFLSALLILELTGSQGIALVGSLLYAVHPLTAESVAWVSGRKDQVSLVLLLAGLLLWLGYVRSGGLPRLLAAAGVMFAACLAKGAAVVFPGLALLAGLHVARREALPTRRTVMGSLLLLAPALAAAGAHLYVAARTGAAATGATHGVLQGAGLFLEALGRYAAHIVAPVDLSIHYELDPAAGVTPVRIGGALLLLVLLLAAGRSLRGRPGLSGLAAAWLLVSLLPFNNMLPRTSVAMADRYLAIGLPLVGAAAAALLLRLPRPSLRFLAVALLLALLVPLARQRVAEFEGSETVFRAAVREDPEDPLALTMLADALLEKASGSPDPAGLVDEAVALQRRAVSAAQDPVRRVRGRVRLADTLLRLRRYEEALDAFNAVAAAVERSPGRLEGLGLDPGTVHHNRAQCLLGLERYGEARQLVASCLEGDPQNPWMRLARAQVALAEGLVELGRAGDGEAGEAAGRTRVRTGLLEAQDVLREARSRKDRDLEKEVHNLLGGLHLRARWLPGWRVQAISHAERLVALDAEDPAGYRLRARVRRACGFLAGAEEDLRAALRRAPGSAALKLELASLLREAGRRREARDLLMELRDREDAAPAARRALGDLFLAEARRHQNQGRLELAQASVDAALDEAPGRVDAHVLRGEILEARARRAGATPEAAALWRRAAKAFEEAVAREPGRKDARLGLARYYQAKGLGVLMQRAGDGDSGELRDRARAFFRTALEYGKDHPSLSLARNRLKSWQQEETRRVTEELRRRARKARVSDNPEEAVKLLEEAVELEPSWPALWGDLLVLHARAREWDRARVAADRLLALKPDDLMALFIGTHAYYVKGRHKRALETGRRFLELAPRAGDQEFLKPKMAAVRRLLELMEEPDRSQDG